MDVLEVGLRDVARFLELGLRRVARRVEIGVRLLRVLGRGLRRALRFLEPRLRGPVAILDRRVRRVAIARRCFEITRRRFEIARRRFEADLGLSQHALDFFTLVRERVTILRQGVSFAREHVAIVDERVAFAGQRVAVLDDRVAFARQRIAVLDQRVAFARQGVSIVGQRVAIVRGKRVGAGERLLPRAFGFGDLPGCRLEVLLRAFEDREPLFGRVVSGLQLRAERVAFRLTASVHAGASASCLAASARPTSSWRAPRRRCTRLAGSRVARLSQLAAERADLRLHRALDDGDALAGFVQQLTQRTARRVLALERFPQLVELA